MFVLAVASQKGGSGKTTLVGHLAVEAENTGAGPVALIDTDPQASLTEWWKTRTAARPSFAKVDLSELREALEEMEQAGMRLTVVDTPPAITDAISRVISCADLVLIPTRPSPHDLRAVGATVEIAKRHRKTLVFVINAATARARITTEAAVALAKLGPVAPVILHNRVDFASSMSDGGTAGEVAPDTAASAEIRELWRCVQEQLASACREDHIAVNAPAISFGSVPMNASAGIRESDDTVEFHVNGHAPPAAERADETHSAERRSNVERRRVVLPPKSFGAADRRVLPFGRRQTDRSHIGAK
jgi:chromosome partitioning protein